MSFSTQLKKHVFLTTFLLIAFVFVAGILLGRNLETKNSEAVSDFMKKSELNTESYIAEQEMIKHMGDDNCDIAQQRTNELSRELGRIGNMLVAEDAKGRLGEEDYYFLKNKFHLMQIKTYILFKKMTDRCMINPDVVLFYYGEDNESLMQGKVLDKLVEDYDIKVLAVEYGYSEHISFLEEYYSVSQTPSLIIDYNKKISGFSDYDSLKEELSLEG